MTEVVGEPEGVRGGGGGGRGRGRGVETREERVADVILIRLGIKETLVEG